ncbi:MAG: YkgJ family cysteine cluster protein [Planctomycetota bacterium]|jgi:Fe-S-cluster containining protein
MTNSPKTHSACEGCCDCCKYSFQIVDTQLPTKLSSEKYEEYLKARSSECIECGNGRYKAYKQYQPCPHLDEEKGICKIYEKRPWYCANYPLEWHFVWKHLCKLMREKFTPPVKTRGELRIIKMPD